MKKEEKNVRGKEKSDRRFWISFLERECLLSKFLPDPTVGGLRGKKESCSTRKGLRVGTRFKEFRENP